MNANVWENFIVQHYITAQSINVNDTLKGLQSKLTICSSVVSYKLLYGYSQHCICARSAVLFGNDFILFIIITKQLFKLKQQSRFSVGNEKHYANKQTFRAIQGNFATLLRF